MANLVPMDTYLGQLADAGFEHALIVEQTENVFEGGCVCLCGCVGGWVGVDVLVPLRHTYGEPCADGCVLAAAGGCGVRARLIVETRYVFEGLCVVCMHVCPCALMHLWHTHGEPDALSMHSFAHCPARKFHASDVCTCAHTH